MRRNNAFEMEDLEELDINIIYALQLETRNNIIIKDNKPFLYNGAFLCYPWNCMFTDKTVVGFNPIFNNKLMAYLFEVFIQQYQIENYGTNIVQSIFLTPLDKNGCGSAVCRFLNGYPDIESGLFVNESLRFIDLMFRIDDVIPFTDERMKNFDRTISYIKENEKDIRI